MFKYKAISKDSSGSYSFLLTSFAVLGIYFPKENLEGCAKFNLKCFCKVAYSIAYTLYAVFTIYVSLFMGLFHSRPLRAAFVVNHITLLVIRIVFYFKRKRMGHLLRILGNHLPPRGIVYVCCIASFVFPFFYVLISNITFITDPETAKHRLKSFVSTSGKLPSSVVLLIFVNTITNVFYYSHYFAFPSMLMILLCAIYIGFVNAYKMTVQQVHRILVTQDLTTVRLADAVEAFNSLKKIHEEIEASFSLSAFLSYGLTFGNILIVIGILVMSLGSSEGDSTHIFIVFSWTVIETVILTVSGSQISDIAPYTEKSIDDAVVANLRKKHELDMQAIILLKECTKSNLHFTGWGMFRISKNLLMTTSGVFVTYGVLYAATLNKEEKL